MVNLPPQRLLCDDAVRLWPVRPQDMEFLYWIAVCDQNAYRWRFRGSVPRFDRFVAHIDDGVLAHFVVFSVALDRRPIGYVVAYDADLNAGHVAVGALMDPNHLHVGDGSSGLRVFADYLFDTWSLRSVFAQVPEYIADLFETGGSRSQSFPFEEVGRRLPDYLFHGGRYYDMLIFALKRRDHDALARA